LKKMPVFQELSVLSLKNTMTKMNFEDLKKQFQQNQWQYFTPKNGDLKASFYSSTQFKKLGEEIDDGDEDNLMGFEK